MILHFLLSICLWGCSDAQEQETATVAEDSTQERVTVQTISALDCPEEPVPLSHIDIMPDASEFILNPKSKVFGRVFRDYQGCYVKLKKSCTTEIGLKKPVLRVECPIEMRDPIFIQCRGTIERSSEESEDSCLCSDSKDEILCPGSPDKITYGDIPFDGMYNPRSERFGWIYVDGQRCFVNAPLESGQRPTSKFYNWKMIACPSELQLSDFQDCPKRLLRRSGTECFCEGLDDMSQNYLSEPIACPGEELSAEEGEEGLTFENGGFAEIDR